MGGNRSAIPDAQLEKLYQKLQQQSNGAIPHNFVPTAQGHDPTAPKIRAYMPQKSIRNPQTEQFLDMLGLPYNLDHQAPVAPSAVPSRAAPQQPFDETVAANPEEIQLDELDEDGNTEAVEAAEAAKQELGQDNGMFHSEELHNYDPASASLATDDATGKTKHGNELSAALAQAMPKSVPKTT